jgi:hypothetical protein
MIIINLLALLVILAAGAVAGVLLTIRYAERGHAERQADGDPPGDIRDPPAPWVTLRNDSPGRREPSALDSRDWVPI